MYSGYYNFDSVLPIQTENKRAELLNFYKLKLNELHVIEFDSLNNSNYTDYRIIENQLNSSIWYLEKFRTFEWDPSSYNVGGSFALIVNGNYADKESRYNSIFIKLRNVPEYYMNAKRSLKSPTLEHTNLAIKQNKGTLAVLSEALNDSISDLTWNDAKKAEFQMNLKKAQQSIDNYLMFLEEKKLQLEENPKRRSFRIGKDLFSQKFEYDIVSSFTAEEIYKDALRMKKELHSKMYDLSVQLWEDYGEGELSSDSLEMIRAVIDNLSLDYCHRDSFITTIRAQISELEEFVKTKDLMYLDPEKPLVVRETPVYMRGGAGASISAPGPYESKGNTYYNVTPLDHYSEDEAESYLKEYNSNMLHILNIHEAIPGHYTQLVYSNKAPSMIKSLFGNGAMIE